MLAVQANVFPLVETKTIFLFCCFIRGLLFLFLAVHANGIPLVETITIYIFVGLFED